LIACFNAFVFGFVDASDSNRKM